MNRLGRNFFIGLVVVVPILMLGNLVFFDGSWFH